jgi:hypothetical protein
MNLNPETLIDGYKVDHRRQYPDGTQLIVSNLTARGTRRNNVYNTLSKSIFSANGKITFLASRKMSL